MAPPYASAHKPMYKYSVGEKITGKMQNEKNHRVWYSITGEIAAEDDTDDLCVQVTVDRFRVRHQDREINLAPWMEWPAKGSVWVFRDYVSPVAAEGEPEAKDERPPGSGRAAEEDKKSRT